MSKISARHHFELAGINVDDITLCRKQACLSHCEQKERRGHCLTCSTVSNDRQCPVETLAVKNLLNTGWQNQLIFKPQLAFHLYFQHLFWKAGFRIGTERALPQAYQWDFEAESELLKWEKPKHIYHNWMHCYYYTPRLTAVLIDFWFWRRLFQIWSREGAASQAYLVALKRRIDKKSKERTIRFIHLLNQTLLCDALLIPIDFQKLFDLKLFK